MFHNPGKRIKTIALVVFCLSVVGAIASVFMLYGYLGFTYPEMDGGLKLAVIIAVCIICLFAAWINLIFIFAYGSLVDDVNTLKKEIEDRKDVPEMIADIELDLKEIISRLPKNETPPDAD